MFIHNDGATTFGWSFPFYVYIIIRMKKVKIEEDCTIRIFYKWNHDPTGPGFDYPEFAEYIDVKRKAGDEIEGEIFNVKGKYLNIKFADGSVGVCITKNIVSQI